MSVILRTEVITRMQERMGRVPGCRKTTKGEKKADETLSMNEKMLGQW